VHPPLRLPTPIRPSVWLMALYDPSRRRAGPWTELSALTAPRRLFSSIHDTTAKQWRCTRVHYASGVVYQRSHRNSRPSEMWIGERDRCNVSGDPERRNQLARQRLRLDSGDAVVELAAADTGES
jgi:hypothetical protein